MENPFVVQRSEAADISQPDIEVPLREQYGQCAEDVIVDGLLTAWAMRTGNDLSTFRYLEIGANHPFATSSSYLLQRLYGMSGVLVDANADLLDALRSARPMDTVEYCAVTSQDVDEIDFYVSNLSELSSLSRNFVEEWQDGAAVGLLDERKVPAMRINTLLSKHFSDRAPIFLSINLEGFDLDILQDVDWVRWRPVVVQAEPSDHLVPGQSTAIARFMHIHGYVLVARTVVNLIFADRAALFGAPPVSQEQTSAQLPVVQPRYSETVSVGIVTRTKNRAVLLRRALESVKHQTYPHWQLVVVNDGGEPGQVDDLVQAIFQGDSRVSVIHHPVSVGMEAASNAGLSQLTTQLAVIHDDDDSWAPDMLAVSTAVLRQKNVSMPSIRGIVTRINLVHEVVTGNHIKITNVMPWNDTAADRLTEGLINLARLSMHNLFAPIGFIFDLALARKLGGFDQSLPVLGDWDFHLRFCTEADIWIHPELLAFYHHRQHATGDLGNTIIAGKSKHELYNTYLRNKMLRSVDTPFAAALALLRTQGHSLQSIDDKVSYISYRVSHQAGGIKKEKSKLAAYLSELNRKRKRMRCK